MSRHTFWMQSFAVACKRRAEGICRFFDQTTLCLKGKVAPRAKNPCSGVNLGGFDAAAWS
jgi:hypothetical protein